MFGHSEAFARAVRAGAPVVTTIDACRAGTVVQANIPWSRPSTVTIDDTAAAWRSCAVTVTDIDRNLLPRNPSDALAPYGADLFIRMGFRLPDGSVEQVPVGLFRIVISRPTRRGQISLIGYDYSRVVARARFETPKVFPRSYPRSAAIETLITERVPFAQIQFDNDGTTLPLTIFEEGERYGSPWKACMEMAEAGGNQVFFGPDGPRPVAILRDVPVATTTPVWDYISGVGSTKIDMLPDMDASDAWNVFVVTGESADLASNSIGAVRASAEITDPASPIYPGTFGRAPTFLASSFIRTQQQAQQVADANLPIKAGAVENLTIVGFGNPAHEAGDVVYAHDEELGINGNQILSRFTLDLSLQDPTSYVCRARRVS